MRDLNRKMAIGAAWMMLFKLTARCLSLVSTLILARLLMPEDFGLIAMAMSVIAILELLANFNFDLMLIQRQQAGRELYDTAWTCNVLFGLGAALVLVLLAHPAALFYDEPRLVVVMQFLAAGTLIQGLENIGIVAFRKEMQFDREFKFMFLKRLSGFLVTVPLAFLLENYWALVAGQLTLRVAGVLLSYAMQPYRPRLSLHSARELFAFSKWLFLNSLLHFVWLRAADFIIGRINGARALGLFGVSYEISNLPTTELTAPINRAVYPGYARMASDRDHLREGYLNVLALISLFALPSGAGIAAIAPLIVGVLLGPTWADAVPVIALLGIYGITNAMTSNSGTVLISIGKPQFITVLAFLRVLVLLPLLVWATAEADFVGAAACYLGVSLAFMPVTLGVALRALGLGAGAAVAAVWRPLVAAAAMYFAVGAYAAPFEADTGSVALIGPLLLAVVLGAAAYVAVVGLLWLLSGRPRGAEVFVLERVLPRLQSGPLGRLFG